MNYNLEDLLQFELDENGFPRLTEKNVKLIDFIIKNDSNYRSDNDKENKLSTINLVQNFKADSNKKNLENIIRAIDKQNSTHLSVSGYKKGNNKGIELTLDYIFKIDGLTKQLKEGKKQLVNEIAKNSIPNRYIISFASKFCTYMSRYMFNSDNFSIYDDVLVNILPYYYYQYVGNDILIKITKNEMKKKGYEWYSSIIDEIIEKVKEKENYNISRKDFDHLLWYYYKGDKDIKDSEGMICHKSRITEAIEKIQKNSK